MWRLFVPLRYLLIRHPEKVKFDLIFPIVFALLISLPLLSEKFLLDAKSTLDVLGRSSDLLSILTGFFVAALAAVSTFGNPDMDESMSGKEPVKLKGANGEYDILSRRRFLAYLFGYLALTSIVTYGLGFAFYAAQTYLIAVKAPDWSGTAFVVFWLTYALLMGNLLSNTLLGLFYLTDRIHRSNRTITFKEKPPSTDENKRTSKAA